ncbi:MAG TPA: hypothetical protein VF637_17505 [Sphingomicrobium sp.]
MLHIHFGAGRLGLGLIAPAFKKAGSELFLVNRSQTGAKATGTTALSARRRNVLMGARAQHSYFIQKPGGSAADRIAVDYDGFDLYDDDTIHATIHTILGRSHRSAEGVVVTASVIAQENYPPVITALNELARRRTAGEAVGRIWFIACENTLSAPAMLMDDCVRSMLIQDALEHVTPVHALVDRMCVGLEEVMTDAGPAVLVRAEEFGSVKLQLDEASADLVALCEGSDVEFSRHVDTEKQIKSWLLNGTHWVIALQAFEASRGDQSMKLNEFLLSDPRSLEFARTAMREMQEGVALSLHGDPKYRSFIEDVDVDAYLQRAADAILRRFCSTEDPITRILARFRAPTPESADSIVSFSKRFAERVDQPMQAYEARRGTLPPAASRGIVSLMRLVANGTFINATAA